MAPGRVAPTPLWQPEQRGVNTFVWIDVSVGSVPATVNVAV